VQENSRFCIVEGDCRPNIDLIILSYQITASLSLLREQVDNPGLLGPNLRFDVLGISPKRVVVRRPPLHLKSLVGPLGAGQGAAALMGPSLRAAQESAAHSGHLIESAASGRPLFERRSSDWVSPNRLATSSSFRASPMSGLPRCRSEAWRNVKLMRGCSSASGPAGALCFGRTLYQFTGDPKSYATNSVQASAATLDWFNHRIRRPKRWAATGNASQGRLAAARRPNPIDCFRTR
jgi:hypothetical protein